MAQPLKIVVKTANSLIELDKVTAITVKPHPAGVQIRQSKTGYTLIPMEQEVKENEKHEDEEALPLEQAEVCKHHAGRGWLHSLCRWACVHGLLVDLDGIGGKNG